MLIEITNWILFVLIVGVATAAAVVALAGPDKERS